MLANEVIIQLCNPVMVCFDLLVICSLRLALYYIATKYSFPVPAQLSALNELFYTLNKVFARFPKPFCRLSELHFMSIEPHLLLLRLHYLLSENRYNSIETDFRATELYFQAAKIQNIQINNHKH